MLDGGCLYKQYASDMTRFWPIGGRFSAPYQLLYDILLTVQKELIEYLTSGERNIAREKLNMLSDELLIKYLREEMILSRTIDKYQAKRIIDYLSPTGVSHHLGLDVHDCEALAFSESLQSGNVITIEPGSICFVFFCFNFYRFIFAGLYIPWKCPNIPEIYHGFAARIEDDILITKQGCENLSEQCPKEINDLYRLLDLRNKEEK